MAEAFKHINPNRMELLKLKRRLALAKRGHKLLKDKQEQLVRIFMSMVREVKEQRLDAEKKLHTVYKYFISSEMVSDNLDINTAIFLSKIKNELTTKLNPIMNLRVPVFEVKSNDNKTVHPSVSGDFYIALTKLKDVFPKLILLSQKEKTIHMVAHELTATRRRVSALENIFIPKLLATIKLINSKLAELERSTAVRLMKIKEIVRQH